MARAQKIRLAKRPSAAGVLARGSWRFVTGRPLIDGENLTDATWTHRGTRAYSEDRPSWWSYQTKTLRVGVRVGTAAGAVATCYGMAVDPAATVAGLHGGGVGVGSLAAAVLAYKATDAAMLYKHNRDYVWPLHVVLSEALQLPRGTRPRHYLNVPSNYNEITGDACAVEVPAALVLSKEVRSRVEATLREKLALQDASFAWATTGSDHHVIVRQDPRPPNVAKFSEPYVRELVEKAKPDAPVIGVSHSQKGVANSIATDSPHILVIMGTNGGKSVLLRTLSAQLMHHGAEVVLLDYKMTSQPWMRRIKGIRYARSVEAIHEALVYVGEEAQKRRQLVADWIDSGGSAEDPDPEKRVCPDITHRLCLFFEEINTALPALKEYWDEIKPKNGPKVSPAITAYRQALNMGRSEQLHVISVGQSGREDEIGPRINYGLRIMGSYDKKMWNLIAETGTAPKKSSVKGRVQVIAHGETRETQVIMFSEQEAIEWATTGTGRTASRPSASAPDAEIAQPLPGEETPELDAPETTSRTHPHASGTDPLPGQETPEPHARERESETAGTPAPPDELAARRQQRAAREHGQDAPEPEPVELVNMAQASKDKGRAIVPMKWTAIRGARRDDPEFPLPDGVDKRGNDAWKPETLIAWYKNRPRTANKS